ncbi:hypothetical protein FDP41_011466 [Naegleria fowleri]|uniref:Uncharacterized protein n=1 Tax=Naegleria fowleri TaxID=5763 RepID=A0A6A5C456_NAEFO|nr:uncharacterized protein FDP41_011466 [Naegleria fowleri]KAF0982536.1 hypothetical protein FDP41_011466 [Naegleria fowleri]
MSPSECEEKPHAGGANLRPVVSSSSPHEERSFHCEESPSYYTPEDAISPPNNHRPKKTEKVFSEPYTHFVPSNSTFNGEPSLEVSVPTTTTSASPQQSRFNSAIQKPATQHRLVAPQRELEPHNFPKLTQKENKAFISLNKISSIPQGRTMSNQQTNQKQYFSPVEANRSNLSHNQGQNMVQRDEGSDEQYMEFNSGQNHNPPIERGDSSPMMNPLRQHQQPPYSSANHSSPCNSFQAPHGVYSSYDQTHQPLYNNHQHSYPMNQGFEIQHQQQQQQQPHMELTHNETALTSSMYNADGGIQRESLARRPYLQTLHLSTPSTGCVSHVASASSLLPSTNSYTSTAIMENPVREDNSLNHNLGNETCSNPLLDQQNLQIVPPLEETNSKIKASPTIPPIGMLKATSLGKKVNGRYTKLRKQLRSFGGDFTDNYFVLDIAASSSDSKINSSANTPGGSSMPPSKIAKKQQQRKYDLSNTTSHHIVTTPESDKQQHQQQQQQLERKSRGGSGGSKRTANRHFTHQQFEPISTTPTPIIPITLNSPPSASYHRNLYASSDIMHEMCPSPSTATSYLYHSQSTHQIPSFLSSPQQSNPPQQFSLSSPSHPSYIPYSSVKTAEIIGSQASGQETLKLMNEQQQVHTSRHSSIYGHQETVATQYNDPHHRQMSEQYFNCSRKNSIGANTSHNEPNEDSSQALLNFLVTLNSSSGNTQIIDENTTISSMLLSSKESTTSHPQHHVPTVNFVDQNMTSSRTTSLIGQLDLMPPEDKSLYLNMLLNELKHQNNNK